MIIKYDAIDTLSKPVGRIPICLDFPDSNELLFEQHFGNEGTSLH